jgi:CheY-like chemotaxis protein
MDRSSPGVRVLIIEDEPDTARSMAMLLELLGHRPEVARSGPEGLVIALATRPEAILLDIGLPGLDGYQVAARLRAAGDFDGVLIVACSGFATSRDRARSAEAGIAHHLAKPVDIDTITALLDEAATRRSRAEEPSASSGAASESLDALIREWWVVSPESARLAIRGRMAFQLAMRTCRETRETLERARAWSA